MAVPGFQEFFLPMLELAGDGKEHSMTNAREQLAERFALTEADCAEMLPSGRQTRFANRIAWTKVHLAKAGLLETPKRGWFTITDRGRSVLNAPPDRLDLAFLMRFQEFREFRGEHGDEPDATEHIAADAANDTPLERLEQAYEQMRSTLAAELLSRLKASDPRFFESVVIRLLRRMGYGGPTDPADDNRSAGADEGIDGVINEDELGLDVIYLQAKRWENVVGRPEIHRFVGALHGQRARKGIFITTSHFSREALEYVRRIDPRVILIDGETLVRLMIDHNLGVSIESSYEIKRIDSDFFSEE